jgi:hypothetical protein
MLSKVNICNLALDLLGNEGDIVDIDLPTNKTEILFSRWYDITREGLLKMAMPSFAIRRRIISAFPTSMAFGYINAFEYPSDCLKVLGLGEISNTLEYNYIVNNGIIYTADAWINGLQLRFIANIDDASLFSPDFSRLLASALAVEVCYPITQSSEKKQMLQAEFQARMLSYNSVNSQENPVQRITKSSRYGRNGRRDSRINQ